MTTTVEVLGKPLGQPRQRHAVRNGHAINYLASDHPINAFKYELRSKWDGELLEGPCVCRITAVFPRPKSKTTKRGPNLRILHTGKPDCDNVAKAVCDALNGVAWKDDSQVCQLRIDKFVAAEGENARTIVTVKPYEPGEDGLDAK